MKVFLRKVTFCTRRIISTNFNTDPMGIIYLSPNNGVLKRKLILSIETLSYSFHVILILDLSSVEIDSKTTSSDVLMTLF